MRRCCIRTWAIATIDSIGDITKRIDHENECVLWTATPPKIAKYIAEKGSICIDGVSLTVNKIRESQHCVTIIPHTMQNTTLKTLQQGDKVNIEIDQLARYVEQLIKHT